MNKRIAYYLWRYPIVSETFIQREINTLKKAGLNLLVVADSVDKFERENPALNILLSDTLYLLPLNFVKLFYFTVICLMKNPIKCISTFCYVYKKKYDSDKTLKQDI